LNYLDRYVSAATLPLILADLAISDAQGGLLQSLFIVAYSLACGPAGWLGDYSNRLRLGATGVFVLGVATGAAGLAPARAAALFRGRRARRGARLLAALPPRAGARGSGQHAQHGHAARAGLIAPRADEPPELQRQHSGPDHIHIHHGRPGDVDAELLRARA